MSTPFYYFVGIVSWPVLRLLYRLRWYGVEDVPPGGIVLASNHVSNFDPWPLGYPMWPKRRMRWMGKSRLFNPRSRRSCCAAGPFRCGVGRTTARRSSGRSTWPHSGDIVVMFPEERAAGKGCAEIPPAGAHRGGRIAIVAECRSSLRPSSARIASRGSAAARPLREADPARGPR